jgi:hypothetical protein
MNASRSLPAVIPAYEGVEADHHGDVLLVSHIDAQIVSRG